jgi:hypothetical protein
MKETMEGMSINVTKIAVQKLPEYGRTLSKTELHCSILRLLCKEK